MKPRLTFPSLARQSGLSLIEILVGVVIGMLGIVVIFQTLSSWEARRYSTAGGADAQVIGAIAIHSLERDIKPAGYGYSLSTLMGCTVNAIDTARPTPAFTFTLAPVIITQGASGAPDTITTLYGGGNQMVGGQTFSTSSASSKRLQSRSGVQAGDLAFIAAAGPLCQMVEISATNNVDTITVNHATGSYVNSAGATVTARYNTATPVVTFTTGNFYDIGALPSRNIWSIRNVDTLIVTNDLRYADTNSDGLNDWNEIGDNIIDLQADYGVDANLDNRISASEWTTTTPTAWNRVLAVRVALLVRNSQYEKSVITSTAPTWMGGTFTMRNVDGTTDSNPASANNWRNYRYRVHQAVVPLRNMLWGTSP